MRPYIGEESETARRLQERAALGHRDPNERHEYLGGIDAATGKLICFRTNGRTDGVELGAKIDAHIAAGGKIVVHHNHVGLHSLSGGDWSGLAENRGLAESWVYCWDGTRYWGRLIPGHELNVIGYCKVRPEGSAHTRSVNLYTAQLMQNPKLSDHKLSTFAQEIGPHIVNRNMQKWGWIEYDVDYGSYMGPLAAEATALTNGQLARNGVDI